MKGCLENPLGFRDLQGGVGLQIFPPVHKAKPAEGEAGGVARLFFSSRDATVANGARESEES